MARTQGFPIVPSQNITATKSFILYEARSFDEAVIIVRTTALNGAPTTATLDVDVEMEAEGPGVAAGGTDSGTTRRWIRMPTKFIGSATGAQNTPHTTDTVGTMAEGSFTQLTQTAVLEAVEIRGRDFLIGRAIRITLRVTFTGGTTPSWTVACEVVLKASSVG